VCAPNFLLKAASGRDNYLLLRRSKGAISRANRTPEFLALRNANKPAANQFPVIFTLRHDACT
jgi:hypothetical protein